MKKILVVLLLFALAAPVLAQNPFAQYALPKAQTVASPEAKPATNFLTEFDITFWQTAPFMAFWSYVIDQQLSSIFAVSGGPHWGVVLGTTLIISVGNAYHHAQKAVAE
jgi:hypothetical protein